MKKIVLILAVLAAAAGVAFLLKQKQSANELEA
jgi:hypothetical protein